MPNLLNGLTKDNRPIILNCQIIQSSLKDSFLSVTFRQKIFRNGFDLKFINPVAEHIDTLRDDFVLLNIPFITFRHFSGNKGFLKESPVQRNIRLLEFELENSSLPELKSYYHFYLGIYYSEADMALIAFEHYNSALKNYIESNLTPESALFGNILLALCREQILHQKQSEETLSYITTLLNMAPRFADTLLFYGICKKNSGDINGGREIFDFLENLIVSQQDANPLAFNSIGNERILNLIRES